MVQAAYSLDMSAAGEHIHWLDGLDGEAAGGQEFDVPGQGGGIAGNVDHSPGAGSQYGVDDLGIAAFAGRVHGEAVDGLTLRHQPG